MEKLRIIIADRDFNYIIPIQQKFIEEFFETVDLEVISDKKYFEKLFSYPQTVDILIISEEFYSLHLQKHNIGNIFLMTEQDLENQINVSNLNQIYKYTSIREIFDVIIGKCSGSLNVANDINKETKIILVYSACGGVGKTTISMGICACLNKNYKRVLYMNADRLQTFQTMLSDMSSISASDVYIKILSSNNSIYSEIKHTVRNEGFSYIPPFKASLMSLGISYSIFEEIAMSAKKTEEYNYIIIDADTVFDVDKTRLIDLADKVVIVTKQNKASVHATNVLMANIGGVNAEKYIFVCNDFVEKSPNMLISSEIPSKFIISDYVEHISNYNQLRVNDLATKNSIQKITFLVS